MVWVKLKVKMDDDIKYIWKKFVSSAKARRIVSGMNTFPDYHVTILSTQKIEPEGIVHYGKGMYCSHKGVRSLD